jgi:glycosyltransferase involved in cell wall biosynthesis
MGTIPHMDSNDFAFDLLTPYYCDNCQHRRWIENHGGNVYELGVKFNPGGDRRSIVNPVSAFLDAHHYDAVHIHSGSTSVLGLLAKVAKEHDVPLVLTHSHSPIEHFTLKNWAIREMCSWDIERYADILCACSRNAAEAKYAPRLQGRVHIIPNGIDAHQFSYKPEVRVRVRGELNLPEHAYVVGHVGRFSYEKNQQYLVEAFSKIRELDESAYLLLVGAGDTKAAIEEQIASLGLQPFVIFTGAIDNVSDVLQAMDVFAFPSKFEALGISLIEAQSTGLPVVASDRVPKEAQISEGYVRLPINPEMTDRWAEAILSFRHFPRNDGTQLVASSGYDVEDTARCLATLYKCGQRD